MLFLTFSNTNIQFAEKELIWRSYSITKVLSTTKWVELIDKKKFAKTVLDKESETFVVYVTALEAPIIEMRIHTFRATQIISGDPIQIAILKQNKAPIKVLTKYSNFIDIFLKEKALVLLKQTELNQYTIELEEDK